MSTEAKGNIDVEYEAFISYRHRPLDIAVAKAIHKQLETYCIPGYIRKKTGRKRMGKVFRDQDELPLLADLGEGICHALRQSRWLIVICSPDLPLSKWCLREIDYFIELGRQDHILTVLVSGEPEDSFPHQLRFINGDEREPLAADVRAESFSKTLKKTKREKLRLLAPMLGVGYDDLRRRQRERVMRTAITTGSVAMAVMAGATAYVLRQNFLLAEQVFLTEQQRQIAVANEAWAIDEKNEALVSQSRFLSGISQEQMTLGNPVRAALLALEALPDDPANHDRPLVPEAEAALRIANVGERQGGYSLVSAVESGFEEHFRYFEKPDILLVLRPESAELFHATSGEPLLLLDKISAREYAWCEQTEEFAVLAKSGDSRVVRIYSLPGLEYREFSVDLPVVTNTNAVTFFPNGDRFVVSCTGTTNDYLSVYSTESGELLWQQTAAELYSDIDMGDSVFGLNISGFDISQDGQNLVYGTTGTHLAPADFIPVRVIDTQSWENIAELGIPNTRYIPHYVPGDKQLLLERYADSALELWDIETVALTTVLGDAYEHETGFARRFEFSPDGGVLVVNTYDERLFLYDAASGKALPSPQNDWHFAQVAFTDERTLVFRDSRIADGLFLHTIGEEPVSSLIVPGDLYQTGLDIGSYAIYQDVFAAEQNTLVTYSANGLFQIWRRDSGHGYLSFEDEGYTLAGFSGDGTRFMLSNNENVIIRSSDDGSVLLTIPAKNCVGALWSPDTTRLLTSSSQGTVQLWSLETGEELASVQSKYENSPFKVRMSPSRDWSYLVLSSAAHTDGLYSMPSLEKISDLRHLIPADSYDTTFIQLQTSVVFLADNQRFCVPTGASLLVVDVNTLKVTDSYDYSANDEFVLSPDGKRLAFFSRISSEMNDIVVIDPESGAEIWQQPAHSWVYGKPIVWSTDSRRLSTSHGSIPETKVWDAKTGELLQSLALEAPSFSPDAKLLSGETASTGSTYVQLLGTGKGEVYDIDTGKLYMRLPTGGTFSPVSGKLLMLTGLWSPQSLEDDMHAARERLQGRVLSEEERKIFYFD